MRRYVGAYLLLSVLASLTLVVASVVGGVRQPNTAQGLVGKLVGSSHPRIYRVQQAPEGLVKCASFCFFGEPNAAVVLYGNQEQGGAGGYFATIAGRHRGGWFEMLTSGSAKETVGPGTSDSTDFTAVNLPHLRQRNLEVRDGWVLVWGRTLSPDAASVETTLDTGQRLRDDVTDGWFALLAKATSACEVRLLDQNGRTIQRLDRTQDPTLGNCME